MATAAKNYGRRKSDPPTDRVEDAGLSADERRDQHEDDDGPEHRTRPRETHEEAPDPGQLPDAQRTRLVMCPPEYLSTAIKNNVFMSGEAVDVPRAMRHYRRVRNAIRAFGVDVLEIPPCEGCQDQTYVANIGVAIDPYIILAKYKAPGREEEVAPARRFFENRGYECRQPPHDFEGEADLKKFQRNVYFGGYGKFTDREALEWIEDQANVHIIPLEEVSDQLYHLDCSLFVIDESNVLLTKAGLSKASIKTIELYANIHEAPAALKTTGITNGVKIPEKKIYLSGTFYPETKEYREAMEWLLEMWDQFGYTMIPLDTDELDKSGADLSCTVFHLDF